jgi:hypothetical protein
MKRFVITLVLYCSVWQGVKTCSGTDGYLSRESRSFQGYIIGSDNQGAKWTRWKWDGFEVEIPR